MPKILILEDDPSFATHMRQAYEEAGFDIVNLPGVPDDVIERAARMRPDCIHLDVNMPGTDGFEAAELLKHDERTAHIPFFFVSTMGGIGYKEHGLSLGASAYFVKSEATPNEIAKWAAGQITKKYGNK